MSVIVFATRNPEEAGLPELSKHIEHGVSPRGSVFLNKAARAFAFLQGRGYVIPEDIKTMARDVMRHRLILSYEAEAEGINQDAVIEKILEKIEVP